MREYFLRLISLNGFLWKDESLYTFPKIEKAEKNCSSSVWWSKGFAEFQRLQWREWLNTQAGNGLKSFLLYVQENSVLYSLCKIIYNPETIAFDQAQKLCWNDTACGEKKTKKKLCPLLGCTTSIFHKIAELQRIAEPEHLEETSRDY